MKVVLYHLTGNENVKAVAYGLAEANLLASFYVSIAAFPGSLISKIAGFGPFSEIKRRSFNNLLKPYTSLWPWMEMGRIIAPKLSLPHLVDNEKAPFYIDAVCKNLDRHVAVHLKKVRKRGAKAVYSYEDIAASSFTEAKRLGICCLYDLPIGYWRTAHKILEIEGRRRPDWLSTMNGLTDSPQKLLRKDEELKMADHIFVASSFTAGTLKDFPGSLRPVHVIPYGFPPVNAEKRTYMDTNSKRRLKLLFVGSLSQRKGIANLFEAVSKLQNYVDLTLVGKKTTNSCLSLNEALNKHHWIQSLPHTAVLQLMREHDVLVFPSLFEGFGLVITEAMSQGTPVITTDRTAGPDLITQNENGWLIEAGSTEALQAAIENLLVNKKLIAENGSEALQAAKGRPWSLYGQELAKAVSKIV